MLCENYMHKWQERENVKTFYEFGNDQKCISNTKEKLKVEDFRIV